MTIPKTIEDIRGRMFAALLSDCLDAVGLRHQAMPSWIRPLDEARILVGRARTAAFMPVYHVEAGVNPYELEMDLVDSLAPDEVPVFACGGSARIAPWGELLSTAAQVRGAAGAVMDGGVRDTRAIRAMGFPVFHGGIAPLDTQGRARVMAIDVPIECAGVPVTSGDLILGDADGIVVVPKAAEGDVLRLAATKLAGERDTLAELRQGKSLREVFDRYGIL